MRAMIVFMAVILSDRTRCVQRTPCLNKAYLFKMVAMTSRNFTTTLILMLAAALTFACDRVKQLAGGFPTPPPETTTPTKPLKKVELKPDAELQKHIETIAAEAKGNVGVAAVVLETGESATLNAEQHFPMQSVYKLPISMAVMHEIDDEKLSIDEQIGVTKDDMAPANLYSPLRDKYPDGGTLTVRELIEYAVSQSDNTACDVLIRLAGGADAIQQYLVAIGIKDMRVANPEREIQPNWPLQYENFATPNSAVTLLRSLQDGNGISDTNREILMKFMVDSTTGPNRLKGMLPKGTEVAHKTGTSGTQNGITAATNDIGIITLPNGKHIATAVFVSDSPADENTREAVIAKIAKAVWDKWGKGEQVSNVKVPSVIRCDKAETAEAKAVCEGTGVASDDVNPNFPFEVTYVRADLNGDKRDEYLVWESSWAGTSGGMLWILQPTTHGFKKLFEIEMTWTPIFVLKSKHHGWNDIVYLLTGGGVTPEFVTVQHNGKLYGTGGGKSYRRKDGVDLPDGELVMGKEWKQSVFGPTTDQ